MSESDAFFFQGLHATWQVSQPPWFDDIIIPQEKYNYEGGEISVLFIESRKMTVFWDAAWCSLVEVYWSLPIWCSKHPVHFHQATQHNILEDSHLQAMKLLAT